MHGLGAGVQGGDLWVDLLIVVLCILLSAFFAGSETALTAASHGRMHTLEKEGDRRAAAVAASTDSRGVWEGTPSKLPA